MVDGGICPIKQGFLIILMKVFSIHFAITGEESNMYYTSSFYQGFTYEYSPWQLLGPEGEVILIINFFLFLPQQEYRLFKRNLCTLSLNFCSFGLAIYFFFRHNWYCEQGSILSYMCVYFM